MELKPVVNVVDDNPGIRESMEVLLRSVSLEVACHTTADAFLAGWDPLWPGCLILDLRMPGTSGLELQAALSERGCRLPIIFLTGHGNVPAAVRAMQHGALDFLTKPVDDEILIEKIHKAIVFDQEMRRQSIRQRTIQARFDLLTPREYQVMEGVVAGKSNKLIARDLGISPKTVELHRANMMTKMHADSVARLVRMRLTTRS